MSKTKTMKMLEYKNFQHSDWVRKGKESWARRKVFGEFSRWVAEVKNSRLAERATKLWEILQAGGLRKADIAAVIGALLYLISPLDLIADFIPVIGLLDDLFVVTSMLKYFGRNSA